jgi:hypothetical protein
VAVILEICRLHAARNRVPAVKEEDFHANILSLLSRRRTVPAQHNLERLLLRSYRYKLAA